MDTIYVDDINVGLPPVTPGARYVEGEIKIIEEKIEEDQRAEEDERTMKLLQTIGNSIHSSIQLEIDYPSRYEDNKMPTLDLKLWVAEVDSTLKIFHEHYTKPMATKST